MKHDIFLAQFQQKIEGMSFAERLDLGAVITESINFGYLSFLQKQKKGNASLIIDAAFYLNFPPQTRYEWEQVDSISCHLAETATGLLGKSGGGWAAAACIVAFEMLAFLKDKCIGHFESAAYCMLDSGDNELKQKSAHAVNPFDHPPTMAEVKAILMGEETQNDWQTYIMNN